MRNDQTWDVLSVNVQGRAKKWRLSSMMLKDFQIKESVILFER